MSKPNIKVNEIDESVDRQRFNKWFQDEYCRQRETEKAAHTPSLSIVATKGTLDWAYPPFILATSAAALGWDVHIFFSFYGLELLKKNLDLKISPIGNPAMPMKMPVGPNWFRDINWQIPNVVKGNVPGLETAAKTMFDKTLDNHGVATIKELRELSIEGEVKLVACQMTVDLFGLKKEDFIEEVSEWSGATSMLASSQKSDITLFI